MSAGLKGRRSPEQTEGWNKEEHYLSLTETPSASSHPHPGGAWRFRSFISSSKLQLHPPSHSWPLGTFGSASTSVSEAVRVWGLLYRPLSIGSDASQTEFQREKGIERSFICCWRRVGVQRWMSWTGSLIKSPLPLRSDNVTALTTDTFFWFIRWCIKHKNEGTAILFLIF